MRSFCVVFCRLHNLVNLDYVFRIYIMAHLFVGFPCVILISALSQLLALLSVS